MFMLLYSIMPLKHSRNIALFNEAIKTKTRNASEIYKNKNKINTQLITAIGICPFLLLLCADFESKCKNIAQIYRRETAAGAG